MEHRLAKHHYSRGTPRSNVRHGHYRSQPENTIPRHRIPDFQHHGDTDSRRLYSPTKPKDRLPSGGMPEYASGSAGIIQDWLVNVSRRDVIPPEPVDQKHQSYDFAISRGPGWRPYGLPIQDTPRQGHKRTRSRDSSIISDAAKNSAWPPLASDGHTPLESTRHSSAQEAESSGFFMPTETLSPRFDKRARRKTREARSESKKQSRKRQSRTREEKPEHQGNPPKKMHSSSRKVMDNFHSEAILNGRLTVGKPSLYM